MSQLIGRWGGHDQVPFEARRLAEHG
jgi:hypothetical protein